MEGLPELVGIFCMWVAHVEGAAMHGGAGAHEIVVPHVNALWM